MDHIEKSNLNRQFLFRPSDIGKPKSIVAAAAAMAANPDIQVRAFEQPVGPATEHVFDRRMWSQQSVVLTALDNWQARLYCDSRCIEHRVPMIEGGTLGATGHTQVVIPHLTAHFGATPLPKEQAVPSCTIHLFPHTIAHVLAWAREQFDALFTETPTLLNNQRQDPSALPELLARMPAAQQTDTLKRLAHAVHLHQLLKSPADCVKEARRLGRRWFSTELRALLEEYPADALDDEGLPFWASPKRPPEIQSCSPKDSLYRGMVLAAARLLAYRHGLDGQVTEEMLDEMDASSPLDSIPDPEDGKQDNVQLSLALGLPVSGRPNDNNIAPIPALQATEFEKDDDGNSHIDFIHFAGMLRARAYGITLVDRLESKRVAGRIVPAMVTTTAAITGLMLMQLMRLAHQSEGKPAFSLESFQEAQLDLATNLLALAEPQPPKATRSVAGKFRAIPEGFTVWDQFEIRLGDVTVQRLAVWLGKEYNVKVNAISCEGLSLYRGSDKATREIRAKMKLTDIYCQLRQLQALPAHKYRLVLNLMCVDKDSKEDVEFAEVSYMFRDEDQAQKKSKKKAKVDKMT